jgi:beta-1,4-mannosyltransferase
MTIARDPDANPFGARLYSSIPSTVEPHWFSWRRALIGRYDILHVHWPEYLFGTPSRMKAPFKAIAGFALLARLFIFRVPVLQTVHTRRPYDDPSWVVRMQSRMLRRRTVFRIYLNESPENDLAQGAVILLGRYPTKETRSPSAPNGSTHLLLFGLLRAYKGIEDLLGAVRQLGDDSLRLTIMGSPTKEAYGAALTQSVDDDPHVELTARRVTDRELASALDAANLVVLPYKEMYNSSALLLALDRLVPVLATSSPANVAIQREVGDAWLMLFTGVLDAPTLRAAIETLSGRAPDRTMPPDLSRRDWPTIGALHAALYEFVFTTPRGRRNPREWRRYLRQRVEADPAFTGHSMLNR